eukprot:CAMPEP_0174898446 /NCGR_PEP_ID=MMETSP0167-20121228/21518_1 /TAXON_ID=38298 /ORGANISM="Rhodella maculata, Strain CCMP736" /LENGTH=156 /DNA_ID=CAMNT_0016139055 /DNA_START=26 /DNA_END=493 /DNA_ORIENTATION=+
MTAPASSPGPALTPARLHDILNLIILPLILLLCTLSLTLPHHPLQTLSSRLALAYLISDSLFISLLPSSVKSPKTILAHHLLSSLLLVESTLLNPSAHSGFAAAALLIESSTILLLLRRLAPPALAARLEPLFLLVWAATRILLYLLLSAVFAWHA